MTQSSWPPELLVEPAARIEAAPRWDGRRAREVAPQYDRDCVALQRGIRDQDCEQCQCMGVVGPGEELVRLRLLDNAPKVHHCHPGCDMPNHGEIMSNKQVSNTEARLQIHQEIDDLRLDRHVECGDGLVANDGSGSTASARAIPMRWSWPPESCRGTRACADAGKPTSSRSCRTRAVPCCAARETMDREWLGQDLTDRLSWVETGKRILEDHLKSGPQTPQGFPLPRSEILTVKEDLSSGHRLRPHYRTTRGGLARARLPTPPRRALRG